MARELKNVENEKFTLQDMKYGMKPEKREKRDTNPVCPGIWRETLKNLKNEKYIFQDVYYGEKTQKQGK